MVGVDVAVVVDDVDNPCCLVFFKRKLECTVLPCIAFVVTVLIIFVACVFHSCFPLVAVILKFVLLFLC